MNLASNLKELRVDAGISQIALAKAVGVSDASICKWENGLSEPTATNLMLLANFFKVSADFLLGIEDLFGNKIASKDSYLSDEKTSLIAIYSRLNEKNKKLCIAIINDILANQK